MAKVKDYKSATVCDLVTVTVSHTGLKSKFSGIADKQWASLISDGSWGLNRQELEKQLTRPGAKVPAWIKDQMLKPLHDTDIKLESIADPSKAVPVELAKVLAPLLFSAGTLQCRFDRGINDISVYANVHFVKLCQDIFPQGIWYMTKGAPLKPLMLIFEGTLLAVVMPLQQKVKDADLASGFYREAPQVEAPKAVESDWAPKGVATNFQAKTKGSNSSVMVAPKKVLIPFDQLEEAIKSGDYLGFCLACGNEQEGCEPDAEKYECESCEAHEVYGAETVLIMGRHT